MSQTQTNPEVKTVEPTGAEIAVTFSESHPCCWVINLGDSDLYASAGPNIVPDADGVYLIPAGGRERITPESGNTIYVYGTGKAMIRGENDRECPSFKRGQKGGDITIPKPAFLPHSEGLTYFFEVGKGVDLDKKVWRDQVQGLEIPMADTQNFLDAVTNNYFSFPESENQYAYTYYTVSRFDIAGPWKLIIGAHGTVPQFNLTNHNEFYGIDAGASAGSFDGTMTPVTVRTRGQFTVNCLNYQSGYGEWYCHRHSMTQPVGSYTSYHAPNNGDIVIGDNNNFKAIAIFKNISQGRDMILENMAFLKNKFELD